MRKRPPRPSGRAAAFDILERVDQRGASSNTLLAEMDLDDERERHLATSLVYGVLRQRRTLDRLIEKTSARPLAQIDPPILLALRLALFQILFLTRVPRAAAVDEAVTLVRSRHGRGAAAFSNGILRSACRLLDVGLDPSALPAETSSDPISRLAETHSFPLFLVERFLQRYGRAECETLLETLNRPAATTLRLRQGLASQETVVRRLLGEGVETVPSPVLPGVVRVVRGAFQRTAVFREGLVYAQDEAAQIVTQLLQPVDPAGGVLDLFAAPGGKLLATAETLPTGTRIVGADVSLPRLRLLEANARRLRIEGVQRLVMDSARPALRCRFGRVLVDAPCSGTGVIRRHPEIRWRRKPGDFADSSRTQSGALRAAADLLAPSGRIVYSVCSLEPEEGTGRIGEFLGTHSDFEVVDARSVLPPALHRFIDESGCLSTLPHRDDMDGFFAAVLQRS